MEISRCPSIFWSMDSPPSLETVYQAVCSLYNNTNPAEPGKASLWLGELQKSVSLYTRIVFHTVLRKKMNPFHESLSLHARTLFILSMHKRAGFLYLLRYRHQEWLCREANLKGEMCNYCQENIFYYIVIMSELN